MLIEKYHTNRFDFWDDTFNINPKQAKAICDEILRRKLDIDWYCRVRADNLSEELVKKMAKAGCISVGMGVESGSPKILKTIRKMLTLEEIYAAIDLFVKNGIVTKLFIMCDHPGETLNDIRMTIEFRRKIKKKYLRGKVGVVRKPSVSTIYPGTDLEAIARKRGMLPKDFSWSKPYYHPRNILVGADPSVPIFEEILSEKLAAFFLKENVVIDTMMNLKYLFTNSPKDTGEVKEIAKDLLRPAKDYMVRFALWDS